MASSLAIATASGVGLCVPWLAVSGVLGSRDAWAEPARASSASCSTTLDSKVEELLRLRSGGDDASNTGISAAERTRFGLAVIMNDFFIHAANRSNAASLPASLRGIPPGELRKRRDSGVVDNTVCEIVSFMYRHYSEPFAPGSEPEPQGRSVVASNSGIEASRPRPARAPEPAAAPRLEPDHTQTAPATAAVGAATEADAAQARKLAEAQRAEEEAKRSAAVERQAQAQRAEEEAKRSAAAERQAQAQRAAEAEREAQMQRAAAAERQAEAQREAEAERQAQIQRAAAADAARAAETARARAAETARPPEATRVAAAERAPEPKPEPAPAESRRPATPKPLTTASASGVVRPTPRPPAAANPARGAEDTAPATPGSQEDPTASASSAAARRSVAAVLEQSTREPRGLRTTPPSPSPAPERAASAPVVEPTPIPAAEPTPPAPRVDLARLGDRSPGGGNGTGEEPAKLAAAGEVMKSIDAALAAPLYLTRKELRVDGRMRTDRELRAARKKTMDARTELLVLLRTLSADRERHTLVRKMLGPDECARVERRIEQLFDGGPGSEDGPLAVDLWKGTTRN